jgi:hypothetical protein
MELLEQFVARNHDSRNPDAAAIFAASHHVALIDKRRNL